MRRRVRVALVTNSPVGGGLSTMTRFLHRVLSESARYEPEIVSLATSFSDTASILVRAPRTWHRMPQVQVRDLNGIPYYHVGAYWPELEFQRYRPHGVLDRWIQRYDLVQLVVGAPHWACTVKHISTPVVLWTATTAQADRATRIQHASPARRLWKLLMTRLQHFAEKRALRQVDHIFALSNYTANTISPWITSKRVDVATCGVDTTLFRPRSTSGEGDYILCVGRLSDPRKNISLLLQAYADVSRRCEQVPPLYLVGDASPTLMRHVKSRGISDQVHFLGRRQGEELARLYRDAQFFVLSSDEEGLGIVILEAMASGLAVISTDCGGPATAVVEDETGFLTPTGDAERLAQAMERMINNFDLRVRMGRAGRKVAEKTFSINAAGGVFLDKYDELLKTTTLPR